MTQDDEEKMAFYTNQGMYCYTKMPFGLKSAGATYHRLVDITFQSQMGRNLEAYVDDIVIKSNDEGMIIADIAEKFDNLRKINMKLNLKKCSFGVEERKCLGYMVTTEGIRANLKKTKEIIGMQSPKTLKEMQSLSGKAVVANHPQKGRNVVCILSGIRERREYSFISRKKWETMPNTLSREEVKQSQKKLFTDREISSLFTVHVAEVTTAHRTSLKQSNDETPFSLTYGSEAVIPVEIGMPTHRTMTTREDENEEELLLNMDLLQERREETAVRERNKASRVEDQGNLGPKWEGPYRVTEAYQNVDFIPRAQDALDESKCKWPRDKHYPITQDVQDESKCQWPRDEHYREHKMLRMSPSANGQETNTTEEVQDALDES
nr:reverse transcriptase domain-containing protein [Tanacetum cinerariifolium]